MFTLYPSHILLLLLSLTSLIRFKNTLEAEVRISSSIVLIQCSDDVRPGTSSEGFTVFLDSDITFTDEFSRESLAIEA